MNLNARIQRLEDQANEYGAGICPHGWAVIRDNEPDDEPVLCDICRLPKNTIRVRREERTGTTLISVS